MQVIINQDLDVQVLLGGFNSAGNALLANNVVVIDGGETATAASGEMDATTSGGMDGNMTATQKDPILASWPFVIGISSGTLFISILIGILLAKRKIKKGFELYED